MGWSIDRADASRRPGAGLARDLALVGGCVLLVWILVDVAVERSLSSRQALGVCIGVVAIRSSDRVRVGDRTRSVLLVVAGAVVVAVGVGLAPHVVAGELGTTSVVSIVTVVGGAVLLITGTRRAWASELPRAGRIAIVAATVIVAALTVWLVAPGVAATHVPATAVTSTPADVGLAARSVVLTTADGVELAAWYLPAGNGAGIVLRHGAGSTRSDVLQHAAVLVRNGYSVVMSDARGHGGSTGTAMDFGWYGDLDIAAGTAFLAAQPEIDPERIGVVGMSMGGEEAIGATATDPLIAAVVAEGATGRQAADKSWFSDVYGVRGWLQERVEQVQSAVTDLLTDAAPPTPLRRAVAESDAVYLIIAAGDLPDETYAAAAIERAAPSRVSTWTVDGAGHTDALATDPQEWQQRVVHFLDATLL